MGAQRGQKLRRKAVASALATMAFIIAPTIISRPAAAQEPTGLDSAATVVAQGDEAIRLDPCQKYLLEVIRARRTVRNFQPGPVPDSHLVRILDAARFAPTAGNQQPWRFLVIRDREKLDRLQTAALEWFLERYAQRVDLTDEKRAAVREDVGATLEEVLSAPVYVAVLVDSASAYPAYNVYDGTLAAGYMMIAARALGYGTGFFTSFFPEDKMREFFEIPDRYGLICFTPVGVPMAWPEAPEKKSLDELVVYERFDRD
jgi:nitroreductase